MGLAEVCGRLSLIVAMAGSLEPEIGTRSLWNALFSDTTHGCHLTFEAVIKGIYEIAEMVDVASRQSESLTVAAGQLTALCTTALTTL